MNRINVKDLVEKSRADMQELAKELFPGNKYPHLAFKRVMDGEALLNSDQIAKLAILLGVEINELYDVSKWKIGSKDKGHITLQHGIYRIEISYCNMITRIFSDNVLRFETLLHSSTVALSEYIKEINNIIIKLEQNGTN